MEATGRTTVNLLAKLQEVPDPRGRKGRRYPLAGILGMLLLAALNGESSLRGMVVWGAEHWGEIANALRCVNRAAPVYGSVWEVMARLSPSTLEAVFAAWLQAEVLAEAEAMAIDGKHLRGSKRRESGLPALQVVTAAAQGLGVVLGQSAGAETDSLGATLALLQRLPLAGQVVTMDAGLLHQDVATTILEKGGPIWGRSKETTARSQKLSPTG
jgi:hypothetical protein